MTKFVIQTHGRLQEWVALEKGYFQDEGLDFEIFVPNISDWARRQGVPRPNGIPEVKFGAYEDYAEGRKADVSCACHWTVNMAASAGHGKLWRDCYTVCPSAVFVAGDSTIRRPEDLAGVEVGERHLDVDRHLVGEVLLAALALGHDGVADGVLAEGDFEPLGVVADR